MGSQTYDDELELDALSRPGLVSKGMWASDQGRLEFNLRGNVARAELVSFVLTLTNPSETQESVTVTLRCSRCSKDPSLDVTEAQHTSAVLGVRVVPAHCSEPGRFGPSCQLVCSAEGGLVQGEHCDCLPNYFGYDCSIFAQPDPERSIVKEVKVGVRTSIGSLAGRGRRAARFQGTRISVDLPSLALTESILLIANVYSIRAALSPGSLLIPLSDLVELRPEGVQFAAPVSLSFSVDEDHVSNVTNATTDGLLLHVMFYDSELREWKSVGSFSELSRTDDGSISFLVAKTSHFSIWSVMGEPMSVTTSTTAAVQATQAPTTEPVVSLQTTPPPDPALDINLIVGIVVGSTVGVGTCLTCIFCFWRRRRADQKQKALESELTRRRKEQRDAEREKEQVRREGTRRAEEAVAALASNAVEPPGPADEAVPFGKCPQCDAPVSCLTLPVSLYRPRLFEGAP